MNFKSNFFSLITVSAGLSLQMSASEIVPLTISEGFNVDVIAENKPVEEYAELDFEWGTFFTTNVNEEYAISSPDSRIIVAKDGTNFELGDYTVANILHMDSKNQDYELKFEEPVPAEQLHILCTCTGTSRAIKTVIKYEDGTMDELEIASDAVPGGYYSSASYAEDYAVSGLKVLEDDETFGRGFYGFSDVVLQANPDKNAVSVTFSAAKSPDFWVFAVSALADLSGSKIKLYPSTKVLKLAPNASGEIVVRYDMNGETRGEDFSCAATTTDECIAIGEITENEDESTFTIPVEALTEKGKAEVTMTVTNGGFEKVVTVNVSIDKPSEFTGWQHDVIVEATPSNKYVTNYLDKDGWVLYTTSVKEEGAVAGDDRTIVTSNGTEFTLEPYDEPNALRLQAYDDPAELTAVNPSLCERLHILAISANGNCDVEVTVGYEDGSTDEPQTITIQDWYGDATGTALHGFDRIFASKDSWDNEVDDFDGQNNFRLFEFTINLDTTKKFQKVSFQHSTNRTYPTILALSLAKADETSGIDFTESDGEKTVEAVYNIQGIEVKNPKSGLYIVRYSDGSTRKVIIK